ncbi:MAG: hypothetical protein MI723_01420 [Caulobacterales bacterium]|nr:hypothetical protein [Caulobacterales bacterium]
MKTAAIIIAGLALILGSFQAFLSWSARDDHIESLVAGRRLDVCAEIGSVAADFAAKAEAAKGRFNAETFAALQDAPREVARVYYKATYLLPPEHAEDLLLMRDLAQRIVGAAGQRESGRVASLVAQFDEASKRVQEGCRRTLEGSPFLP